MKKSTRVLLGLGLVIGAIVFGVQAPLQAMEPPIVYVAGDGSGDYNCDGSRDQVEINQALDYVANNADYTTVYLKGANTYWIDEPIVISSHTKLTGDATAKVQVVDNVDWPNNKPMLRQNGPAHWNDDETVQRYGTSSDYISDVEISGFEMTMGTQDGVSTGSSFYIIMIFYTAHNIKVHDMYLHDNTSDLIRISCVSGNTNEDLTFYNNVMHGSGHEGLYLTTVPHSLQIYNNEITGTRVNCGIRMKDADEVSIHGNIIGNRLAEIASGYAGIYVRNKNTSTHDVKIYDNYIYGKTIGIKLNAGDVTGDLKDTQRGVEIHHNRIYGIMNYTDSTILHGAIWLTGPQETIIESNTIDSSAKDGIIYEMGAHTGTDWVTYVKNNIISNTASGYALRNEAPGQHTFISSYNDLYNNANDYLNTDPSSTNISVDPMYVNNTGTDPSLIDLHLKSEEGTYNDATQSWDTYSVTSGCIDAGDPTSDYSNEPAPNGGRINIGAYGNTEYASKKLDGPEPPSADAGIDQTVTDTDGDDQQVINFDASNSSDYDGNIVSYAWDFGDGTSGSGVTPSHTYNSGDTYTATLTVTDNDGLTGEDDVQITIYKTNYNLVYTAEAHGSIDGNTNQIVAHGNDGSEVTAMPEAGYNFSEWSDGVLTASRTDTNVTADINVSATFHEGGAISEWLFNEGSGTTAADVHGNNNITDIPSDISWVDGVETQVNESGSALKFTGVGGSSISVPNSSTLEPQTVSLAA